MPRILNTSPAQDAPELRQLWQKRLGKTLIYAIALFILWSFTARFLLEGAIKAGNPDHVRIILAISVRSDEPLTWATQSAVHSDEASRAERLQILSELVRSAFPEGQFLSEQSFRKTGNRRLNEALAATLESALKSRDAQLFNALLDGGLLPDPLLRDGRPIIFEVIEASRLDLLASLHQHGANLNLRNTAGKTPLAFAVCRKDMKIVNYLIRQGVTAMESDLEGRYCRTGRDPDNPYIISASMELWRWG
jgi:ankyrin repeat protein